MTEMRPNYTSQTYQCLELVIPFIIFGFAFVHFIISISLFFGRCGRLRQNAYLSPVGFCSDIIYPYANVIFRSSLKKYLDGDDRYTYRVKLHRQKIQKLEMFFLSSFTSLIISLAFFAFWDTFLIRNTYVCDPRLDCFERNFIQVFSKPIDNCNTTDIVICYEFVFDLIGGSSSAVGVVGIFVLYFNMNLTILSCLRRNYYSYYCRICYIFGVLLISVLPCIIIGVCAILFLKVFRDLFERSNLFSLQVIPYVIGFFILAPFSAGLSCVIGLRCLADFVDLGTNPQNFDTHIRGYKMSVQYVQEESGDFSIVTHLLASQFNQHLSWPFKGKIIIQIMNRDGDHHHITKTIRYNNDTPDGARRVEGDRSDEFRGCTFTHNVLLGNNANNIRYWSDTQTLHLRVIEVKLYPEYACMC